MSLYEVLFYREQRASTHIEADSEEDALVKAEEWIEALDLDSKDDESDDPGEYDISIVGSEG
jgi:hypothetical protein